MMVNWISVSGTETASPSNVVTPAKLIDGDVPLAIMLSSLIRNTTAVFPDVGA
ncbi:MAG TPA: hypothetical protein PLM80_06240 [Mesotoga sp.]|nr:hypothetical protein [Mesotoga sp.]MDI9375689.1 hypothetical protein [Thermotogota bacterium]MDD4478662.1 hypothetical protein [Mesotoga sp.]MDD5744892.1 hypothetical protein [Mesotoga sp.]HPB62489.1 hypothetical protein [Mesotoga sp.]